MIFRRKYRARGERTRSLGLVNVATLIVSALAMIIALVTAYITLFEKTEGISAVVVDVPYVSKKESNLLLRSDLDTKIIVINSGNTPAVVIDVNFELEAYPEDFPNCSSHRSTILTKSKPFTVKGGDIGTITVRPVGPLSLDDKISVQKTMIVVPLTGAARSSEPVTVDVCVSLLIATPSQAQVRTTKKVARLVLSKDGVNADDEGSPQVTKPIELIERNQTAERIKDLYRSMKARILPPTPTPDQATTDP